MQFQSVPPPGGTDFVSLGRTEAGGIVYAHALSATTNAQGRIEVPLRLARGAGRYFIRITAPSLAARDSSVVDVRPGALVRIVIAPIDTALLVGEAFVARPVARDRWDNVRSGDSFSATAEGPVSVTGLTIQATAIGRARIRVSSGSEAAHLEVSVVPPGAITTVVPGEILTTRTNATLPERIPFVRPEDEPGSAIDWSSDGRWLVSDVFAKVRVHGPDGSIRLLTAPDQAEVMPQFSADGQWIYFARQRFPMWELRRRRPDGSGDTLLAVATDPIISPAPNGFEAVLSNMGMVQILDLTTGQTRPVAPGRSASWSPDGTRIAYRDGQVVVVLSDGSGQRRLPGTGGIGRPEWSPDSKYLAVLTTETGFARLALVNAEQGDYLPLFFLFWQVVTWRP